MSQDGIFAQYENLSQSTQRGHSTAFYKHEVGLALGSMGVHDLINNYLH